MEGANRRRGAAQPPDLRGRLSMAERMVRFLEWDGPPAKEVWVNPRHVVFVHQPFGGATLEFARGGASRWRACESP